MGLRAVSITNDYLGAYAWASLPAAASWAGYRARVTDGGPTGGIYVVSDGVRWKPVNGTANLKTLGAAVSGIANAETIVLQTLLPANFWQANDTLRIWLIANKSGTTDGGNMTVRIGTAGTTADTAITGFSAYNFMAAGSLSGGGINDVKLISATSAQKMGAAGLTQASYQTPASTGAAAAATTITDASANALYVSLSLTAGGVTNTLSIASGSIQLVTP